MITVQATGKQFWTHDVEAYLFFMDEDLHTASNLSSLGEVEKYYPDVKDVLKKHKFDGKVGQSFMLTAKRNDKLAEFIFIGIGKCNKDWNVELETLRRALGSAILLLKKSNTPSAVMALPPAKQYSIDDYELLKQLTIVAHLASYEYITFKKSKQSNWHCNLIIEVKLAEEAHLQQALNEGNIIGEATNMARHWADLPGNILTPTRLAQEAEKVAIHNNLKYTVFGKDRAEELGMGAFLAVDAGSAQDCKFVVMEYQTNLKHVPTIAIVGKGVTYDTGGISLKASSYMNGMHYDMSGAGAVIATMQVIAQLKANVNVVGITPLVENMPSGTASRQDDIITAMNGKTIEIKNTDAEGRLILADALCYAEKFYAPDIIIDIATLTGACLYALGYFYAGLMTQDKQLLDILPKVGTITGDRVWPLPFDDDFKPANDSYVADVANSGSSNYKAGTIIGACFLSEFVEKARWAHLDIAGTADAVPKVNYLGSGRGATGTGVRLFSEYILNYSKYQ